MSERSSDETRRLCFLIGPIGGDGTATRQHADWVLHGLVKPALEAEPFFYKVMRADDDDRPGQITAQIIDRIVEAELVVADLTGMNPNVLYELAIRHMVSKPVIQLCDSETTLPFDIQNERTIKFDISSIDSVNSTKERIKRHASEIEVNTFVVSNPVTAAKKIVEMNTSPDSTEQMVATLLTSVTSMQRQIVKLEARTAPRTPLADSDLLSMQALKSRIMLANALIHREGQETSSPTLSHLREVTADEYHELESTTPSEAHFAQPSLGTTLSDGEVKIGKDVVLRGKKTEPDSS